MDLFNVEIRTGNESFEGDPVPEIASLLREVAQRLEGGDLGGSLRDTNGNLVGSFGEVS